MTTIDLPLCVSAGSSDKSSFNATSWRSFTSFSASISSRSTRKKDTPGDIPRLATVPGSPSATPSDSPAATSALSKYPNATLNAPHNCVYASRNHTPAAQTLITTSKPSPRTLGPCTARSARCPRPAHSTASPCAPARGRWYTPLSTSRSRSAP
jgi:hypothetical protein